MELFDSENRMRHLSEVFKKTDEFYSSFKKEFGRSIYTVIHEFYPAFEPGHVLDDILQVYAEEILSATESVIDKDHSYPEYRLDEELRIMNRLVNRESDPRQNEAFMEAVHRRVKKLMVTHYPDIAGLSGYGFRLLEKNAKMYNLEFMANFYTAAGLNKMS